MVQAELSTTASVIKLVLTVAIFGGIAYAINFLMKAVNEGVECVLPPEQSGARMLIARHLYSKTKAHLGEKGIKFNKNGCASRVRRG